MPAPSGATASELTGVSCRETLSCTAVGEYTTGADAVRTLAESWNGSRWVVQTTPTPTGAELADLTGVGCLLDACTAVGSYSTSAGLRLALAESWNGSAWSLESPVDPSGSDYVELDGISCWTDTSDECIATGTNLTNTGKSLDLAEMNNGSGWLSMTTPTP